MDDVAWRDALRHQDAEGTSRGDACREHRLQEQDRSILDVRWQIDVHRLRIKQKCETRREIEGKKSTNLGSERGVVGPNEKLSDFHIAPDSSECFFHALTRADDADCTAHLGDHKACERFTRRCFHSCFLSREHVDSLFHQLSHQPITICKDVHNET